MPNNACVPNKTEDLNLNMFNIITGINNSKVLIKHISCGNKCRLDRTECNSDHWWNSDKYHVKKVMYVKKIMFEILLHVIAKMRSI